MTDPDYARRRRNANHAIFDGEADITDMLTDDDPGGLEGKLSRYLLCEDAVQHSGNFFTTHDSPEDAVTYHDTQECADDWTATALIDLDTGERFTGEVTVTIPHTITFT